jgi:hypothetical protein
VNIRYLMMNIKQSSCREFLEKYRRYQPDTKIGTKGRYQVRTSVTVRIFRKLVGVKVTFVSFKVFIFCLVGISSRVSMKRSYYFSLHFRVSILELCFTTLTECGIALFTTGTGHTLNTYLTFLRYP